MVKVYYTKAASAGYYVKHAKSYLTEQRYRKFEKLQNENDKLRCLAGGMLLTKIFGEDKIRTIRLNAYGKPYMENGAFFNLAHSGDFVVLAVDRSPVGIDIEACKDREYSGIAKLSFHQEEQRQLAESADPKNTFYTIWTLKESYMKQKGRGFNLAPKSFYFDLADGITLHAPQEEPLHFYLVGGFEGYAAALCTCSGRYDKSAQYIAF